MTSSIHTTSISLLNDSKDDHKPQATLNNMVHQISVSDTFTDREESQDFIDDLLSTESSSDVINNANQLHFHRIYIFDFDDTIFPTSILQKNMKIWNYTESETINNYKQCQTLYQIIKNCIEYIINLQQSLITKYGKENISFVIITNASKDWFTEIKQEHSSLIGELIHKLESNISIISAKDEFMAKYDDWYKEYSITAKMDSFMNYINTINLNDKIPIIYSIGDGKPEYNGSKLACEQLWDDTDSVSESPSERDRSTEDTDDEDQEDGTDGTYILHRIQLKSNRKSKNHTFKSLDLFWNILEKTEQFLFHSDDDLVEILEKEEDDEDEEVDDDDYEQDKDDDDDNVYNIIDHKL